MGQDFFRRIDGYNSPFLSASNGSVVRGASLSVNAPAGPGRIESINIIIGNNNVINFYLNPVPILIDGTLVWGGAVWFFIGGYDSLSFSGPVSGMMKGNEYITVERKINLDYESTARVSITNSLSPDPSSFYILIAGRVGR